jgi:NAD(P)H-hydrate epimerase
MNPVLSVDEMRRVDAETTESVDQLMDRAGYAVALVSAELGAGYGSVVRVLCGKGNNGGDGYVAATYLAGRGATVIAHAYGQPPPDTPAGRARERARRSGVSIVPLGDRMPAEFVIDAIVGTGFEGTLGFPVADWTETDAVVVCVDIPSGLDGDTGSVTGPVFVADATVTFHTLKTGHLLGDGPDLCGEVVVADIGLSGGDPNLLVMERHDVVVPHRPRHAFKWSSGAVLTVGGMPGLTGAAALASAAALRAGAGVSNVASTPGTDAVYQSQHLEVPVMSTPGNRTGADAAALLERLDRFDALIVGPGLEPAEAEYISALLDGFGGAVVVDAGALNATVAAADLVRDGVTVLTPHAGEFKRLTGSESSLAAAQRLAADADAIVVMKGNPTFIVTHEIAIVVDIGGPELATIGTGDVLAGIIGAFLATSNDPLIATASAAYIHALAGSRAATGTTPTVLDVLDQVGPTVRLF